MELTWLGWAGIELRCDGVVVVIDPLLDTSAVFEGAERAGLEVASPNVSPSTEGVAVAALLTHLHRDHADAAALARALQPGAPVLEPQRPAATRTSLATRQADAEIDAAALARRSVEPWDTMQLGPFGITALPAVDGLGDPQVSWLVEAGDVRVVHLGDTMYHGHWWKIAELAGPVDVVLAPINGPVTAFPHLLPPSPFAVAMDPDQAMAAAHILGARQVIPIHYDGYRVDGVYEPTHDALERFRVAASRAGVHCRSLTAGDSIQLEPA